MRLIGRCLGRGGYVAGDVDAEARERALGRSWIVKYTTPNRRTPYVVNSTAERPGSMLIGWAGAGEICAGILVVAGHRSPRAGAYSSMSIIAAKARSIS